MNSIPVKPRCAAPRWPVAALWVGLAIFMLGGCASVPKPESQLNSAQQAVYQADGAGAGQFAPSEMRQARGRYEQARTLVADGKHLAARREAELAQAYAELARAKALAERAAQKADRAESDVARLAAEAGESR